MADYAIHDTTLIGTSNIIRKKEGSSALIDPADYPKRINLMGMLEEKTVSGSIVTFSDGADDVSLKSCEVALSPSLDGYSSVDVVGTGKNLVDESTIENDYQININSGLPTAWNGRCATTSPIMIHGGNITVSFSSTDSLVRMMYSFFKNGTFIERVANIESGTTINAHDYDTMYIGFANVNGVAITKDVLSNIQIEVGSTATAHEPYTAPTTHTVSLGRTIRGGVPDVVKGEGRETYPTIQVGELTFAKVATHTFRCNNFDRVFGNGKYNIFSSQFATYTQGHSTASNIATLEQGNDNTIFTNAGSGTFYISTDSSFDDKRVEDFLTTYGNAILIYETTTPTDFTFDPVEINSRLGNNTMWSDGDMSVTYRASGTVTPIVPTLISKSITANGTYTASDDGVDGYDEVVVNVPSGLPSGDYDDFLGIQEDYTRYNVQNLYSSYYVENELLKKQIVFQLNTGSGYEGFCVSLDGLNLTEGQTYKLSFVLDVPSSVTFSGSYQWGMKHSASRLPTSGSANSNTFNTSTVVDFAEQTGTQNVSITFTAGATNYLIVLLARIAGSRTEWLKMRDVQIEEASAPSLLSMMPSEEVNENTEEVEEYEQNESEG